ncbi:phosphatase [Mangrovactinospora gilvigrisea]|uniref:Phosphatase n=1 Tax=Mangrovactinospora gilvigrisea TaxID=1428644 RepID=A0A1J7BE14_9ACTN|nr:PHP domain-containing protein [Mangrovactinospora gilvigrisea]OIV36915.1 phosphatase [Mangrovactinospora gilvigrisea]
MPRIDLHTHSNASDGTDTPAQLVANAARAGLGVVALTDHDTTAGYAEAAAALAALPAEAPLGTVVPGAELSTRHGELSVHLLAYLFDPAHAELVREMELLRTDRVRRAREMTEKCVALGAPISWPQVERIAAGGAVGRPHVASALVEAGVVGSVSEAFVPDWLGAGGRAYVHKRDLDAEYAVRLVREAGGVPVVAHPAAAVRGGVLTDEQIAALAAVGLAGLEADHPDQSPPERARIRGLAAELGLITTGSSDYHGGRKTIAIGAESTAPEALEALLAQATGNKPLTR